MPEDIRWRQRFDNYKRILHRLTLAVELMEQRPLTDLEKQGLIKGFEFSHELAWNVLKDYLEYEEIEGLVGSRSTVREAFKRGLVTDGETWMEMIEKRNLSSHTYDLELATELAEGIRRTYCPVLRDLQETLGKER